MYMWWHVCTWVQTQIHIHTTDISAKDVRVPKKETDSGLEDSFLIFDKKFEKISEY